MTNNSVIETIKERIDIVELIGTSVQLRKAGRSFVGFCPFHSNTRTPAFTVYPDTQSYHCFGCKASGTVFDFVMRTQGIEFREALEQLAQRSGVELTPRTQQDEERDNQRERLIEVNTAAARLFQHMLIKSPRGEEARAYVARRMINDWALESFQLGYSPDERTKLFEYLTLKLDFSAEEVVAAGLAIQRDDGSHYDRFRGRVIFPIRNIKGHIIAFGGRAMGDAQPKYLNSPQTLLFDKSSVLYGLDMAREAIRQQDAIVIVEGYVDVIALHQHGFRNVVAPLGTALTADHVQIIKKLTKNIYLALDADSAGIRATLKGLQTLHDNLDSRLVPTPTPHGVLSWSRNVDAQIRIIELPDGKDPDELLAEDAERWPALVANALPAMDFYMQVLTRDLDLTVLADKRTAVDRLAPLISQLSNQLEQTHYVQQLAHLLKIDETLLRRELRHVATTAQVQRVPRIPTPSTKSQAAKPATATPSASRNHLMQRTRTAAEHLLMYLLQSSDIRDAITQKLEHDLKEFPQLQELFDAEIESLFVDDDELRGIWRTRVQFGHEGDLLEWFATLNEQLRERAEHIGRSFVLPKEYLVASEAIECVTIVQRDIAKRWNQRLSQQLSDGADDDESGHLLSLLADVQQYINYLHTPKRSSTYDDLHTRHMG
ncbi:MAG: DNA primase [Chloroflexi bacterium]|nr:DNA primase [Chloroflexota bacterium]